MKKTASILFAALLLGILSCCGSAVGEGRPLGEITVISREEGSGTRGAFVERTGIQDENGDHTLETAEISNSTAVVTQTVMGNPGAIGYVSLGALGDGVKTVRVDGAEATAENIRSGDYGVSRPFVLCYDKARLTALGRDFLDFVFSADGQTLVREEGYIPAAENEKAYGGSDVSGSLSVGGSTSVAPLMEVLAEAYREKHPDVTIDIQQTGSGAGILSAADGSCEIGMSSRELHKEELDSGLTEVRIALDGIAVIVNKENPVEDLTLEELQKIFTGKITRWSELEGEREK